MTTSDGNQMALQDIRENIARDIREPVLHVCQTLFERLAVVEPHQLQRLTYKVLADFAQSPPDDDVFHAALTALTTIKHSPLVLYFIFYDEADDREISITASDAMQSVDESLFIHPRTGEEVHSFESKLKPVYKASKEFMSALTVSNGS